MVKYVVRTDFGGNRPMKDQEKAYHRSLSYSPRRREYYAIINEEDGSAKCRVGWQIAIIQLRKLRRDGIIYIELLYSEVRYGTRK